MIEHWLEISNLNLFINERKLFSNLNISLAKGENIVILGPNGSGKSLLIRLIERNLYPKFSRNSFIRIFGSENINIWALRKRIGFMTKDIEQRIDQEMSVKEVIISGLEGIFKLSISSSDEYRERSHINNLINIFYLNSIINKSFKALSEGEKKRVLIARSLAHEPEVLILDEPTSNLDIKASIELRSHLRRICQKGTTLIQITHDISTIIPETNKVILIKNGKIVAFDSPSACIKSNILSALYETNLKVLNKDGYWQMIFEN